MSTPDDVIVGYLRAAADWFAERGLDVYAEEADAVADAAIVALSAPVGLMDPWQDRALAVEIRDRTSALRDATSQDD
ncbi:hypothetical protein [Mycobacterium sp.]|uniref:hypothetical protein n=1 Tax=Mycobacterium sp. TaxID=1785 RepID=UPI003F98DA89